jgi:heme/copper-type cytochrome/quinol oxidase subunit 1
VATDLHLTDSYYVVGHFHATMFGGFVFPFFAALYYWYPQGQRPHVQRAAGRVALLR